MKKIVLVFMTFLLFLFSSILTANADDPVAIEKQWVSEVGRNSAMLNVAFVANVRIQIRFVWRQIGSEKWNETYWIEKNDKQGTHTETISNLSPDTDYEFRAEISERTPPIDLKGDSVKFFTKINIEIQVNAIEKAGVKTNVFVRSEKGGVYLYENDNKGATFWTTQNEFFVEIVPSPGQNKITVRVGRHTHSVEFYADE